MTGGAMPRTQRQRLSIAAWRLDTRKCGYDTEERGNNSVVIPER